MSSQTSQLKAGQLDVRQHDVRQLDARVEIVTAENIAFQYRVSGPFRRVIAYVIDLLIRLFVCGVIGIVALVFLGVGVGGLGGLAFLWAYFVLDWFYGGLFETFMNGQTPGKHLLQIRVISVNGQPVSGWQAILRNVLRAVDAFPMAWTLIPTYQLGMLVMLLNPRFQRLGDLACGTMVVVEERQRMYGVTRILEPEALKLAGELPANITASRGLGRALSAYVQRRQTLGWGRRKEIAAFVGEPLRVRFGLPADTNLDLLLCAVYHRVFIADLADDRAGGNPFGRAAAASASQVAVASNAPVVPTSITIHTTPAAPAAVES